MKSVGSISCAFLQHFDFVGFLAVKNMPGVGDAVPDFSLKDHTGAEAEDQFPFPIANEGQIPWIAGGVIEEPQGIRQEDPDLVLPEGWHHQRNPTTCCNIEPEAIDISQQNQLWNLRLIPQAELQRDKASNHSWRNLLRRT